MCKKFFQSLLGGGGKQKAVTPPAIARPGGDEGGDALILASDVVANTGSAADPNGGRVRLSGGSKRGDRVAGLSI